MTNPFALDTRPATPTPAPAPVPPTPAAQPVAAAVAQPFGDDPFGGPAAREARGPRLLDIYGRLLLIVPHSVETVVDRYSKTGGTKPRMTADVVILDGGPCAYGGNPEKPGGAPHDKTASIPHKNARMFISAPGLLSACREALAKKAAGQPGMVLGRLRVGEAKSPDQSPPYFLAAFTDADRALALDYLAKQPAVDPFAQ